MRRHLHPQDRLRWGNNAVDLDRYNDNMLLSIDLVAEWLGKRVRVIKSLPIRAAAYPRRPIHYLAGDVKAFVRGDRPLTTA